jgi:hypothetical protein
MGGGVLSSLKVALVVAVLGIIVYLVETNAPPAAPAPAISSRDLYFCSQPFDADRIEPASCVTCPLHGSCREGALVCEAGYEQGGTRHVTPVFPCCFSFIILSQTTANIPAFTNLHV